MSARIPGRERSRFHWWLADAGDPAAQLESFLAAEGFPVIDLTDRDNDDTVSEVTVDNEPFVLILFSAAAGAVAIGAPPGPPSPTPNIPDVVAVVYDPAPPAALAGDPMTISEWVPSWSAAEHAAAVEAVREAIERGDVYQTNIVGHERARYRGDPTQALTAVSGLDGARYGGLLTGEGWAIASGSPENLVTISGTSISTRPIKGTRPRTAQGLVELKASGKERAEHIMIVDLARNDLARIGRIGSIDVSELYEAQPWCDLWQMESTVRAELADGAGLADVLRALCPPASVTGAPKRAAVELIAELEPVGRGPAMGAFGRLDARGLELGVTIRTVAATDGELHLWAGGGITYGSDADAEVAEAQSKARPLRAAIHQVGGFRF